MNRQIKVSVIIPIYSVEKYVSQCIESILDQRYPHLEIILVDDGSPDHSPEICDQYAERYANVRVIHKPNGGLSDARNCGVEQATGDYILFVDGDDFWDNPVSVSSLINRVKVTHADVLNFSFKKFNEDTEEKTPYFRSALSMPLDLKTKHEQLTYLSENGLYLSSAWSKLIRRELLDEELLFEKGVYSEDIVWSARLLKKAKSMDFVDLDFYCYRQRGDSISHVMNERKCKDLYVHIMECLSLTKEVRDEQLALRRYAAYQFSTFFIVQAQMEHPPMLYLQELSREKGILKYHGKHRKMWVLHVGCTLIGYINLCKLIRFVYCLKK